ncbi:alpha/beta fold hydrolase [Alicycliphilus denitrificans]|uniref:alpha/beta fold hydrolase n=1 Tax=Alicycliphilus denitrificans TaxID=179636 RepID=UPI003A80E3F8
MHQLLIGDLPLVNGEILPDTVVGYETFGQLDPNGGNAVLITHGLTSGIDMLEPSSATGEGSWADLLRPGRALDARHYFVVCSNVIGSSLGSSSPASRRPGTNRPWGPEFPSLTISDMVNAQRALLAALGVNRLRCVVGPSFGGMQALQWALDYPEAVDAIGVIVSGLQWPPSLGTNALRTRLASDPAWAQGWYVADQTPFGTMAELRYETLVAYGMQQLLEHRWPGEREKVERALRTAAQSWARRFDANALLVLQAAGERFDVRSRLSEYRCPMLFVPSLTDQIFPPSAEVRRQLAQLPIQPIYIELDTPFGHAASGVELHQWEPALIQLLAQTAETTVST